MEWFITQSIMVVDINEINKKEHTNSMDCRNINKIKTFTYLVLLSAKKNFLYFFLAMFVYIKTLMIDTPPPLPTAELATKKNFEIFLLTRRNCSSLFIIFFFKYIFAYFLLIIY